MADGILLYGIGSQGDYLALQLKDNRLLLNINLGTYILILFQNKYCNVKL